MKTKITEGDLVNLWLEKFYTIMKEKIKIIWFQYENSMGFTGWRIGYERQDGLVGDFDESLIKEYDKIYDINWVEEYQKLFNDYKKLKK